MAESGTKLRTILRSATLYLGLLALFVAGAALSPQFLTMDNQRDVLWQVSGNGILAIGMTLVILTAGIDLSVGSLLSLCSVVCAMLLMQRKWTHATMVAVPAFAAGCGALAAWLTWRLWPGQGGRIVRRAGITGIGLAAIALAAMWAASRVPHGFGVIGVLLLVPPVGLLLGLISGAIIAKGKLQPFIVTLAMMVSAVGLAKYIAGQGGRVHPIYTGDITTEAVAPESFKLLASNITVFGKDLIPVPGLFFAGSALLAALLLSQLRIGRYIYAVGGNEETARLSGINTDRIKMLVYSISGVLCAVAAVLYCAQYEQGKADAGFTRELDAIAAVVIGGTSLMGGRGGVGGTIVGVFIFGYLGNILNLRGVSTEFQSILKGFIIVLAVLLQEGILARWIGDTVRRLRRATA
ncbi:MAG: ABC transporter permease [Phycisphaerae bacterium]|nr:ABC transporter permease [Phycisphaerae bacterium]